MIIETYAKDLSMDLFKTGQAYDEEVINQSIERILMTSPGERLFNLNFGSNLVERLFDNMNANFLNRVLDDIVGAITKLEDRITIDSSSIQLLMDPDNNAATIVIPYYINITGESAVFKKKIVNI